MAAVAELAGVTIRRGSAILLDDVSLRIDEGERWVVIGPNGAGKTTLLQLLSAQMYPTDGVVGILDEVIGAVDVFELRPRIGLTSSALAQRIPDGVRVRDVVLSAAEGRRRGVPPPRPGGGGSRRKPRGGAGGPCWPRCGSTTWQIARSAR